jgi:pimeloyl-ACP methyl ester carboxylesterase
MFQDTIKTNFNYCFGEQRRPYQLEIQAYVENWAQELKDITAPSCIWHGDSDNWVPGKMSKLLSEELSQCKLNFIDNSGHYSCLQKYIAKTIE